MGLLQHFDSVLLLVWHRRPSKRHAAVYLITKVFLHVDVVEGTTREYEKGIGKAEKVG